MRLTRCVTVSAALLALAFAEQAPPLQAQTPVLMAQASTIVDTAPTALFVDTVIPTMDSVGVTPTPAAGWQQLAGYAITLALGLLTPYFMQVLESLSAWLTAQPAVTKRVVVSVIPGLVSFACAMLARQFPWFPWDPEPVNALIATGIAYAVHAGDVAKALKPPTP